MDTGSRSSPWVVAVFAIVRFVFARYEVVIVLSIDEEVDLFIVIAFGAEEQASNAVGLFAKVVAWEVRSAIINKGTSIELTPGSRALQSDVWRSSQAVRQESWYCVSRGCSHQLICGRSRVILPRP